MIPGMGVRSTEASCGGQSLFSMGGFPCPREETGLQANGWSADGLIGLPAMGLGTARQKRITGDAMIQDDVGVATSVSRHPSLPTIRAFEGTHIALHNELSSLGALHSGTNINGQSNSSSASQTYASSMGASLSRNIPCISAIRVRTMEDGRNANVPNLYNDVSAESGNLVASLSGLNLSSVGENNHPILPLLQDDYQNLFHLQTNSFPIKQHYNYLNENLHGERGSPSQYLNTASPTSSLPNYDVSGRYPPALPLELGNQVVGNNIPPLHQESIGVSRIDARALSRGGMTLDSNLLASAPEQGNFARHGNHRSRMDLMGSSYLRSNEYSAATLSDMRKYGEYLPNSQLEYLVLQKAAYSDALLPKTPYGLAFGFGFPCPGNPMVSPTLPNSTIGSDGPFRHMEHTMRSPSSIRNIAGNFMGPWPSELGYNLEEMPAASLLDEFKENKIRCFKLSEISGHIVEFSADQYGSRLIQQKLVTASTLEKNMVFLEIMPHALYLITDVFGNYVIQKFFECGNPSQISQLADQLIGNVLTLSLQMYGCRVIQKAIEVVELDQLTKMVAELDGHIMPCVLDQNGNHVIQKCIEYIPEADIQFIVTTFYDHAVTLSCHPFGCRVIQRVLEQCHNPKTLSVLVNEILQSVCVLAQDQYGNYVIQHLLEHGKPHERSTIISQLIGKTVEMSQQKFASNVIEKCLSFGTPEQRKTLVHEMLGSTNENEPLQVMMKDQFANYVVQKVMETCDDQLLELLLKRMKVHLNTLKKYTYGKHIVARLEKLVAAGERRISILSTISA